MDKNTELKAGDPCPNCGGQLAPNPRQSSERLIANHRAVAHDSRVTQDYERRVREKVAEHGELYSCTTCGYMARFKAAGARAENGRPQSERSEGGAQGVNGGERGASSGGGAGETHGSAQLEGRAHASGAHSEQ
jgi:predicted RNA-binding Zn-ribbon protein involved in translation (DUF1610 family)